MKRTLHDGREDGLEPLEPLDVEKISSFAEMLRGMSRTAFAGRRLGEAYEVLREMVEDPDCTIVVTLSGAMTIAKMGRVLCTMIDHGMADIIVSTGALMAHGLSEAIGGVHYKHDPSQSDEELYEKGYNRVYDTLEMEANLSEAERLITRVLRERDPAEPLCSFELHQAMGRKLTEEGALPSILGNAYRAGVPVYVPAFTDSELGLDVATQTLREAYRPGAEADSESFFSTAPVFNPFLDLLDITKRLVSAKRLGIFTIGGGVPRNWAQQVAPFIDVVNLRLGSELSLPRYRYAVRICPEPVHWGGLSGCTYSEGVSWGKFLSPEEGGRFAEVHSDATIAWPLLIRAVLEGRSSSDSGPPGGGGGGGEKGGT
ncbi:MAG: deoxyhypusine synthase family protein [Acidobacteriota bacterium]